MANSNDNLSDIRPDSAINANVAPAQLPIRGEKRLINATVNPDTVNAAFEGEFTATDNPLPTLYNPGRSQMVEPQDFNITAALQPYVDYVVVRLYNRGLGGNGTPDGNPAVYRFLINPSQVQINRTTLDGQAFARAGWQIGVWGEDSLQINLTGKTAGQYFSLGLTDQYQYFTESYRNLEQLQAVFENNGYWFEGEQAGEGPLAADFTRRIIKMHADVELIVGNFIWQGMFESLTISQSAEEPFLMSFQISFIAWKERYRPNSPWPDTIHNDVKRGADYGSWASTAIATQTATQQLGGTNTVNLPPASTLATAALIVGRGASATPVAPAVSAAEDDQFLPQVDPTSVDSVPMDNVIGLSQSTEVNAVSPTEQPSIRAQINAYRNFWNGVL